MLVEAPWLEQGLREGNLHQRVVDMVAAEAVVKNPDTGYVFCPSVNHTVDPLLMRASIHVTYDKFLRTLPADAVPKKVFGVSNRGKEAAMAASLMLGLTDCVTDRVIQNGNGEPYDANYSEDDDITTVTGIQSFTRGGKIYTHTIRGLRPGDTALVYDDFCAYGRSSMRLHESLGALSIRLHHAFLVAKDFPFLNPPQTGYRELKQQGISAFTVVRFTGIEPTATGHRVIATAEDI